MKSLVPNTIGLEPKGEVYGGWEKMGIAGHCLGHYLSACSMMYAATGDEQFKKRVDYIVDELALCQEANGNGYVAAIPNGKEVFGKISRGDITSSGFDLNGCWVPWYTEHKIMAGLRDAYLDCDNNKAMVVLKKMGDWTYWVTRNLTDEQWQKMLGCEHGGMNEICIDLYALTGNEKYKELALKFYHKFVLDPLSNRDDKLAGLHANTQVPKVIGAARIYEMTGQEKFKTIADFFWNTVVDHYSFVNGGNSANEHFGRPDELSEPMHDTTEACNTYNMLKLTRHLFAWKPDASYMDYYERALYNHILAHQHPVTGMIVYKGFLDMPAKKNYCDPFESFWCCVGTGMENHVKYGDTIYYHDDKSLYVNLFIPSVLTWKDKGLTLTQKTTFPESGTVNISIACEDPIPFSLKIRKPAWAKEVSVKVNGESRFVKSDESGYIKLNRTFKDGDSVELQMPMTLHTEGMPDKSDRIAFLYGPVVLANDLGDDDPLPVLLGTSTDLCKMMKQNKSLEFKAKGVGRVMADGAWKSSDLDMKPLYSIADQRYTVYMDTFTDVQWEQKKAEYRAEQKRLAELEDRTVDVLRIGEMQPERDHAFKGGQVDTGEFSGLKWRHALNGGWFSFELKVLADEPMELLCTYWGGDAGNRVFDIMIDDQKIVTQVLENNKPGEFFDVSYPIPEKLTRGKDKVVVRFHAHPGKICGGLFGKCRMMKYRKGSSK